MRLLRERLVSTALAVLCFQGVGMAAASVALS